VRSGLLWRRSATAGGLYLAVAFGILGTIVAARRLGLDDFGLYATVMAAAGFFQTLLDLTVEESLTKYGFRYVAAEDWGRLRRLFGRALQVKLGGGALAMVALAVLAPLADAIFDADGLTNPLLVASLLPLVQAPENVGSTALLLRGRYDLRGGFLALSMGLRLVAILVGTSYGVTETVALIVVAQVLATASVSALGWIAFRRYPVVDARSLGDDRHEVVSFVMRSSAATGMLALRTTFAPLVLGAVAGSTAVGLLRVAQAPQSGFAAASSPVRLILLTEQTRDWEHGRERKVLDGVKRYMLGAAVVAAVSVPVFMWAMPWLVRVVFGEEYEPAVAAARIVLVAAAVQLVFGWTKSFPVTIGRPGLRIVAHGIETAVLLPLVAALGAEWGVTGAAWAILAASVVFAVTWAFLLVRVRAEVAARALREPALAP
jgi:O-antigen/teichoic acid export membrane protein